MWNFESTVLHFGVGENVLRFLPLPSLPPHANSNMIYIPTLVNDLDQNLSTWWKTVLKFHPFCWTMFRYIQYFQRRQKYNSCQWLRREVLWFNMRDVTITIPQESSRAFLKTGQGLKNTNLSLSEDKPLSTGIREDTRKWFILSGRWKYTRGSKTYIQLKYMAK